MEQTRYIVIARDQHGIRRVYGIDHTVTGAAEECYRAMIDYSERRPDLQLTKDDPRQWREGDPDVCNCGACQTGDGH